MNHRSTMLKATAMLVAAIAVTGIAAMAIPQQVLAGGHHHNNGIKVNQSVNQANACPPPPLVWLADESQSTICVNSGNNNADIQH